MPKEIPLPRFPRELAKITANGQTQKVYRIVTERR